MTMRIGATALVLLIMLALMIQAISNQNYWAVGAWLLTGLACAACTLGISCPREKDGSMIFYGLGGLAMLAWFASALGSDVLKPGRQQAQFDLLSFFTQVQGGMYDPISQEAKKMAERGYWLCATQRYFDMSDAVLELQKAYYLGPGSSLALGAYESWLAERPKAPTCLSTFIDFSYQAPELAKGFLRLNKEIEEHLPKR
ncbi:hypothetical protein [Corticimicrobacter populi]|nr:hypothetical protein [Corticimicrobacter populi]